MHFAIAAGDLGPAITAFAQQANIFISGVAQLAQGLSTEGLQGHFTVQEGLARLLAGTGLEAQALRPGAYCLHQPTREASHAASYFARSTLPEVTVKASAIAGDHPGATTGAEEASGPLPASTVHAGILGVRDTLNTPFSTTAYTSQWMARQQSQSVAEVLKFDPSVRNFFPEDSLGEHFHIRGLYTQSQEFAWNGLYGLAPHYRFASEFLERVEVLRGPSGLLYGMAPSGGTGGVVNLVPKRALPTPLTQLTLSGKTTSTLGAHLDLSRRMGVDEALGVRINTLHASGKGTVQGQKDQRTVAAVALDVNTTAVRAALDAVYLNEAQRNGLPLMTTFANRDIPAPMDATTNTSPGIDAHSIAHTLVGSVEVDITPTLQGFAALGWKRQHSTGALNNALGMQAQASGDYTGVDMAIRNQVASRSAQMGLRAQWLSGPVAHQVTLSASRVEQREHLRSQRSHWASNLYAPREPVLAAVPAQAPKTAHTVWQSVALADTLSWNQGRYQLTAGLRAQQLHIRNERATHAAQRNARQHAITPSLAWLAHPWQQPVSVYANYSEGLSQGDAVTDSTAANYGEVFKPYKSRQMELGVKWEQGQWSHTVSVYQITRPSLIVESASRRYAPNGRQRNRGLEWTFAGAAGPHLEVVGGVARLQAVMTHTSDGLLNGKTAQGIAHWQANAGANWQLPAWPAWQLNAAAIYTGSAWVDTANTQRLPHWMRLDLGLSYTTDVRGKSTVVRLNVVNALNRRYWAGVWNGYASVGAARTFKLSMAMDF